MDRLGPAGAGVEALRDERDHLMVQVSLETHSERPDSSRIAALKRRLTLVEAEIAVHQQKMP